MSISSLKSSKNIHSKSLAIYKAKKLVKKGKVEPALQLAIDEHKAGRIELAEIIYKQVLISYPKSVDALHLLGILNYHLGKIDLAVLYIRKALSINPYFVQAHRHLAMMVEHSEYNEDIELMEKLFRDDRANNEQKMHLAFGLGKVFEDLKDFIKAFEYFDAANSLKRASIHYSHEQTDILFKQIKTVFTKEFIEKNKDKGVAKNAPIFIVGMPRSGTSLVEQIISSHSKVHGGGELYYLTKLPTELADLTGMKFPEGFTCLEEKQIKNYAEKYLFELERLSSGSSEHVTDKRPLNFIYIGMIKIMFPNAKIIHCQRDPMDTCLSIFKYYFTGNFNFAYNLSDIGHYYKAYRMLMQHWEKTVDNLYTVNYEALVHSTESKVEELLEFCELELETSCFEFHKNKRAVSTASAAQVRKPIYKKAIKHWQHYASQLAPLKQFINGMTSDSSCLSISQSNN